MKRGAPATNITQDEDPSPDDPFEPVDLNGITDYKPGDELQVQGKLSEIVIIKSTGHGGFIFVLEDDRQFLCSSITHEQRGRLLKANHA